MTTLYYVFDPLCGWCYGATAALSAQAESSGVRLVLLPSGLFSGEGARPMDDDFAAYAWVNDQRIARLTGQPFSERYRTQVLGDRGRKFDSGPATQALTAVALTSPERELDVLKAIQRARYVEGKDVTDPKVLAELLRERGLDPAAAMIDRMEPAAALLEANRKRVAEAQSLMVRFRARGVPVFLVDDGKGLRMLHASAIYSDPKSFAEQLTAMA